MLFDPFINGVAELHDRHRDMRLDVDNMSYEVKHFALFFCSFFLSNLVILLTMNYEQELLALEERIGDVKTGLNEEVILKSMKQRKYVSTSNLEPCCICRVRFIFNRLRACLLAT